MAAGLAFALLVRPMQRRAVDAVLCAPGAQVMAADPSRVLVVFLLRTIDLYRQLRDAHADYLQGMGKSLESTQACGKRPISAPHEALGFGCHPPPLLPSSSPLSLL